MPRDCEVNRMPKCMFVYNRVHDKCSTEQLHKLKWYRSNSERLVSGVVHGSWNSSDACLKRVTTTSILRWGACFFLCCFETFCCCETVVSHLLHPGLFPSLWMLLLRGSTFGGPTSHIKLLFINETREQCSLLDTILNHWTIVWILDLQNHI